MKKKQTKIAKKKKPSPRAKLNALLDECYEGYTGMNGESGYMFTEKARERLLRLMDAATEFLRVR